MKKLIALGFMAVLLTSCNAYRTNVKDVNFSSVHNIPADEVLITMGDIEKPHENMGFISATVKKLTLFHKSPTEKQANRALSVKASNMGADAVKNVTYTSGMGWDTYGFITADGEAVKYKE